MSKAPLNRSPWAVQALTSLV